MQPSIESDARCPFCGDTNWAVHTDAQRIALYVECFRCKARGPTIDTDRPDAGAQVRAAWAAGRKFGNVSVAAVPGGMPSFTCSAAERIRLIAEGLYKGDYGDVEGVVVLLQAGKHVHTIPHNISPTGVFQVLDAVRNATATKIGKLGPNAEVSR